ncbi:RNA-guided endonuclease IscB [Micromonospora sp. NPDC007271]|uniref:RNA-guided endonuclease IscB n=1 Tax=Micromonospora sp. NPDC007271 TaxID=3154587 RepID=UPI003402898E
MLPQPRTLESVSADTAPSSHETGHGRRKAAGVRHGRGETGVSRRHPEPASAGTGAGREAHTHPVVFVVDRHHRPLQPCSPARARKLLASGRAVVHRHTPFVIRLKDREVASSQVDGVEIGVDPGSKFTGIAVFRADNTVRTGLFAIEVRHRGGQIRDKLTARAVFRRGRRSRNLRYRAPRFLNRRKPDGWLAPSLRHRIDNTMSWVDRLRRWAPVTGLHVERVAFDTQLLQNPNIAGVEYQHGTLHGYEVREYLLAKWGRECAYCGVAGMPLNIDHIVPRSRGGSDRVSNLTLACVPCNQAKDVMSVDVFLADRPAVLARIRRQAQLPLRDAAAVSATRRALWQALAATGLPVEVATGGRTKWNRHQTGAPKTHTLDALHVGTITTVRSCPGRVLVATATSRGSYARTRCDRYGFPRLRMPRSKSVYGFQTGDLVHAVVPAGKNKGRHTGRVAVRTTGSFNIRTSHALVQGIHHRHVRLLQRADGWAYTREEERRFLPALNGRVSTPQHR